MFITKIPFSFYLLTFIFLPQSAFRLEYKCLGVRNSTVTFMVQIWMSFSIIFPMKSLPMVLHSAQRAWCRQSLWAYIEEKDCQSCIANATNEIRQKKSEWLTQLAGQASINPPMVLFGQLDIGESNKLNASVQCTRDLLSLDCMKCLSYSIGFLPKCCDSRKAVRLFSGTCELRFEAYYNKA